MLENIIQKLKFINHILKRFYKFDKIIEMLAVKKEMRRKPEKQLKKIKEEIYELEKAIEKGHLKEIAEESIDVFVSTASFIKTISELHNFDINELIRKNLNKNKKRNYY